MVAITNGIYTFIVPSGSVGAYKRSGYKVINSAPVEAHKYEVVEEQIGEAADVEDELSEEDAIFISAVEEKPISQWTNNDVRKYAALNDIDISSAKSAKEAKGIIKKHFDSRTRGDV